MTPQQFATTYASTAKQVSVGTGLSPDVLLAQWACETAWASAFAGTFNLGNIRDQPGSFAQYTSLAEFVSAAIATYHNGYYPDVLAAAGKGDLAQITALGASPWDAGHYNNGGGPGSGLLPFWRSLVFIPIQVRRATIADWWVNLYNAPVPDEATLANWSGTLKEDGSNWDSVFAQLGGTPTALATRAKIASAGVPGPVGPPGPAGQQGPSGPAGPQGPPPDATSINNAIVAFFKKLLGL